MNQALGISIPWYLHLTCEYKSYGSVACQLPAFDEGPITVDSACMAIASRVVCIG